jgi:hypothetical protein
MTIGATMSHSQLARTGFVARNLLIGALLAMPLGASAQAADPAEPFLGTWSGVFTTQSNEYWTFADLQCFVGCRLDFYNHFSALLADPANDQTPAMALSGQAGAASLAALDAILTPVGKQVRAANRPEDDPKFINCQPYGFVREVTNPLPLQIRRAASPGRALRGVVAAAQYLSRRPRAPRAQDADLARAFRGALRRRRADRGDGGRDTGLDLG